jgi:hypothetical protein
MLRRSKPQGTRFLLGLLAGEIAGSALLATALFGLGSLLAILIPLQGRVWLTTVAILVFGLLDMINRTPHIWRQVPQRFVRSIPPGRLGLVWGFDLALLFTTQKATSLTWVALAGVTLLQPNTAWPVLTTMAVVGVMAVAIRSVVFSLSGPSWQGDRSRPWFVLLRKVTGFGLAVLAVILAVQAV